MSWQCEKCNWHRSSEPHDCIVDREQALIKQVAELTENLEIAREAMEGIRGNCEEVINDLHADCGVCKPYQAILDALQKLNGEQKAVTK